MSASDGATCSKTLPPSSLRAERKRSSPPSLHAGARKRKTATDYDSDAAPSPQQQARKRFNWRRSFQKLKEQQEREQQNDALPQLRLFSATQTAPIGWQKPAWFHHEFQSYIPVQDPTQERFWPLVQGRLDYTAARMLQTCESGPKTPPDPKATLDAVIKATKRISAERQAKLLLDDETAELDLDLVATPSSEMGDRIGAQTTVAGPWVAQHDYFGDWKKSIA